MKKQILIIILPLLCLSVTKAQENFTWTPFLQQTGMYYSSDNITSEGFGLGLGLHMLHKSQIAAQADINILWGNGNAVTTRFAAGYQRKGTWAPAVYGTLNLIWGQRTEILSEFGQHRPAPIWVPGIRMCPLKFQTKYGYVSALELGYGFGPDKGMSLEFSILSVGISF
jgi:hypothetical protein